MVGRLEAEIQSVFEHWLKRNEEDVPFGEVKRRVDKKGMSVNRMALEMDWAYFAPLTLEETCEVVTVVDSSQESNDDDE